MFHSLQSQFLRDMLSSANLPYGSKFIVIGFVYLILQRQSLKGLFRFFAELLNYFIITFKPSHGSKFFQAVIL